MKKLRMNSMLVKMMLMKRKRMKEKSLQQLTQIVRMISDCSLIMFYLFVLWFFLFVTRILCTLVCPLVRVLALYEYDFVLVSG